MNYVKLERQPNFPYEDLSIGNASKLTEEITDKDVFERHYDLAVTTRPYFSALHTLQQAAFENLPEESHADIDKGIKLYETASHLVTPYGRHPYIESGKLGGQVILLENHLITDFDAVREIREDFATTMSRTSMAIATLAMRLWPDTPIDLEAPNYFVTGAALAHRLEADVRHA